MDCNPGRHVGRVVSIERDEAMEYDRQLEFDSEPELVRFIKDRLLTDTQRARLAEWHVSVEDLLNGRVPGPGDEAKYAWFFDQWNAKLGRKEFGF